MNEKHKNFSLTCWLLQICLPQNKIYSYCLPVKNYQYMLHYWIFFFVLFFFSSSCWSSVIAEDKTQRKQRARKKKYLHKKKWKWSERNCWFSLCPTFQHIRTPFFSFFFSRLCVSLPLFVTSLSTSHMFCVFVCDSIIIFHCTSSRYNSIVRTKVN